LATTHIRFSLSLHDALPFSSPFSLRRSVKSLYVVSVIRSPYVFAVLSQRMVPCSTTHFSSPFFFHPIRSFVTVQISGLDKFRRIDRKSTRLNSSHRTISYAV